MQFFLHCFTIFSELFASFPRVFRESEILFIFCHFWAATAAKHFKNHDIIQSAASAASLQGRCACIRLDHGLKL